MAVRHRPRRRDLNIEFVALANHRKAIRDEIARYARRFRELQLEAIAAILDDHGIARSRARRSSYCWR